MLLLLCLSQLVAPDPVLDSRMHAYFLKAEKNRAATLKGLETQEDNLEIAIRGEGQLRILQEMKSELKRVKASKEQFKKTKPFAVLNDPPDVGDVGILQPFYVAAVIDGQTAILSGNPAGDRSTGINKYAMIVVTKSDTKPLRMRERAYSRDVWIVLAEKSENESVARLTKGQTVRVLEPIKKIDLERHRASFEKWRANEEKEAAK